MFQLRGVVAELRTAESKAPTDASAIADQLHYKTIYVNPFSFRSFPGGWLFGRILALICVPFVAWRIPRKSVLFVQFPDSYHGFVGTMLFLLVRKWRKARIIMLVHDIAPLRTVHRNEFVVQKRRTDLCLGVADVLIVHNIKMRNWLSVNGYADKEMICLRLFDYLTDVRYPVRTDVKCFTSVMIPGYLAPSKAGYLAHLKKIHGIDWHLFGVAYDAENIGGDNIFYHGSFPAKQLPSELKGAFGLIWDGDSIDTCQGVLGLYLQYNNPHKFSLFMASGVPVIVWKGAAVAHLVSELKLGFVVDSLQEVPVLLQSVTAAEYDEFSRNVRNISARVRSGEYLKDALRAAEGILGSSSEYSVG